MISSAIATSEATEVAYEDFDADYQDAVPESGGGVGAGEKKSQ
jgi:hypothetical protein